MRFLVISQLSLRRLNAVFSAGTVRGTASSAAMRLVQFCHRGGEGGVRVGVEQAEGQGVIDLKAFDPSIPSTMRQFLEMGQKGMDCAKRYQECNTNHTNSSKRAHTYHCKEGKLFKKKIIEKMILE